MRLEVYFFRMLKLQFRGLTIGSYLSWHACSFHFCSACWSLVFCPAVTFLATSLPFSACFLQLHDA